MTGLICRCATTPHALDADSRIRARRALEAAQRAGNKDLADYEQSRLNQCPTTRLTVQERPAS